VDAGADINMVKQKSGYAKARNIFLVLFLLSTFLVLLFAFSDHLIYSVNPPIVRPTTPTPAYITPGGPIPTSVSPGKPSPDLLTIGTLVGTAATCLSSIVTFVGFVSTAILTWRKEGREKADRELEMKRKEIALEKERLELEKMKAEQEQQLQEKGQ
jgi:hypothetical protein